MKRGNVKKTNSIMFLKIRIQVERVTIYQVFSVNGAKKKKHAQPIKEQKWEIFL